MAANDNARLRAGILTSYAHEAALRSWAEGFEGSIEWSVGVENPDVLSMMTDLSTKRTDVIVIDDDALVYKDVSEPDMLSFAEMYNRNASRVVFLAGPERAKDDAFLESLIGAGVTSILPTRYFSDDPEGARSRLLSLMQGAAPSAEAILAELAAYPTEKKRGKRASRRQGQAGDVLATAPAEEIAAESGEKMSEAEYFDAIRKEKKAKRDKAKPKPETNRNAGAQNAARGGGADCASESFSGVADLRNQVERASSASAGNAALDAPAPSQAADASQVEPAAASADCITLAVAGIRRGVGTTHLTHAAAFCIAEEHPELKVCCLMNDSWDFDVMRAVKAFPEDGDFLTHKRVWFAKMGTGPIPGGFDVVVMDCGVVRTEGTATVRRRFAEADGRFVVCGGPPWRIADVMSVLSKLKPSECSDWMWCMFGADPTLVKTVWEMVRRKIGRKPKIMTVPYYNDYFTPLKECPPGMVVGFDATLKSIQKKKDAAGEETGGRK